MFKSRLGYRRSRSGFFVYHNISNVFRRIEFSIFILFCIILITGSKFDNKAIDIVSIKIVKYSTPVVRVISFPLNSLVDFFINLKELVNARNKNVALNKENMRLKSLYIKVLNIKQENVQLKKALRYAELRSTKYLAARLIAYPYQTYSNNVFINVGRNKGVKENDIVSSNSSVVGRIIQVGDNKSRVLLPTDINSRIPVIISGSRAKGILAGNNSNTMKILYLGESSQINIGDMVFTSGDGDYLPPGLLVGVITKINNGNVEIKMVENIKNLDVVNIIKY